MWGPRLVFRASLSRKCPGITAWFRLDSGTNQFSREICSRDRYITHFYCLAVEAGFYSDVVECLPLDPAAQVRFPPRAVGIFLHPVTFGGHCIYYHSVTMVASRSGPTLRYSII